MNGAAAAAGGGISIDERMSYNKHVDMTSPVKHCLNDLVIKVLDINDQ